MRLVNMLFISLNASSLDKLLGPCSEFSGGMCDNNEAEVSRKNVIPPSENVIQITKNTKKDLPETKITSFISFIPGKTSDNPVSEGKSDVSVYREILSENTDIEALKAEQPDCADSYQEYLEIMLDYVCFNTAPLKIRGNSYPAEVVKKRMLELKREHLEYVSMQYDAYLGEIVDFKKHCAALLCNSYYEVSNQTCNMIRRHTCERILGAG
jgi:hypothetical protein